MECDCGRGYKRKHEVIRKYVLVAEYVLCASCHRVEWLWLTDEFESEINSKPFFWSNEVAPNGLQEAS